MKARIKQNKGILEGDGLILQGVWNLQKINSLQRAWNIHNFALSMCRKLTRPCLELLSYRSQ